MLKSSDDKYLRGIYQISYSENSEKSTISELAYLLDLKPPTVLERLKTLQSDKLITYDRDKGILLTKTGQKKALNVIRKHRIWETFLHKVCKFNWSEVHDLAEQLQMINSEKLIDRIYSMSGEPKFDPHGDPIPDKEGILPASERRPLTKCISGCKCSISGVNEDSSEFLNYLSDLNIGIHDKLSIEKTFDFDGSIKVKYKSNKTALLSSKVAENILVSCNKTNCLCKNNF